MIFFVIFTIYLKKTEKMGCINIISVKYQPYVYEKGTRFGYGLFLLI